MKESWKRVLTILLTLAMLFTNCSPVLGAEESGQTAETEIPCNYIFMQDDGEYQSIILEIGDEEEDILDGAALTYRDGNGDFIEVQAALTKYSLALQKNKQTQIWIRLCQTLVNNFNGKVTDFFAYFDNDIQKVRHYMQVERKKDFPYLSGKKLCNYWLYVMYQYTNLPLINTDQIYIATDRHIIRATHKLGLITDEEVESTKVQDYVIKAWIEALKGTNYVPIDFQSALWLWSRNGFKEEL